MRVDLSLVEAHKATGAPIVSYAPEVIADSSGKWAGNALRFATVEEATANVLDLFHRWMSVTECRVIPSSDPVSCAWVDGQLKGADARAA